MANDLQVLADGAERSSESRRPPSPLMMLGVLAVLGVGFVTVSLVSPNTDLRAAQDSVAPVDRPVGDFRAEEMGIGEVVTGFKDTLVGVANTPDESVLHVLWPTGRSAVSREVTGGDEVRFDISGLHIAVADDGQDGDFSTLSVGRVNSIEPVATGVTSFAWHDSTPGQLAYTTVDDGVSRLWRVVGGFAPKPLAGEIAADGRLAAWGDWGFAIQRPGSVTLLNEFGLFKANRPGTALTSTGVGWIFVADDELDLVSAGGGVARLDVAVDRVGPITTASFSPDGGLLAIAGGRALLVIPARGEGEIREFAIPNAQTMAWTADSRFISVPMDAGVQILDLETVNGYTILEEYQFESVGVIPAAGS